MRSKVSKFFAWVIVGLLIIGLAGFGIQDALTRVGTSGVVKVGQVEITQKQYILALQQEINYFSSRIGKQISLEEAQSFGLDKSVLQGLIQRAALDQLNISLGLSRGNDSLIERITSNPNFQDLSNNFDRQSYYSFLKNNGLTEKEYEKNLRDDLTRSLISNSIANLLGTPTATLETLVSYMGEKRKVFSLKLNAQSLDLPQLEVSTEDAESFYKKNESLYMKPKSKRFSYILLDPNTISRNSTFSEKELFQEFENSKGEFGSPELRKLDRIVFKDIETAYLEYFRLKDNPDYFETLLTERNLTQGDVNIGFISKNQLKPSLQAPLFEKNVLSFVGPLDDDLGPSIYRINEIKSEIKASYELAKPIIIKRFQYTKGLEEVDVLAPTLSDEIAGGASLEELEREYNITIEKLDLYTGAELPDTFRNSKFEAMAAAAIDSASDLEKLPNQSMISIRLDSESPAAVRPFSEVKDNIRKTLKNQNTLDALYDKAVLIKGKYTSAKSLKEFAAEGEVEILIDQKLSRYENDITLPEKLLAQIFSMKLNQVKIQRFNESEVGYVTISFLEKVIVPNRSETVKLLKTVSKKYDQEILNEVLFNFVKSIETEFKIAVNQRSIDSALASIK